MQFKKITKLSVLTPVMCACVLSGCVHNYRFSAATPARAATDHISNYTPILQCQNKMLRDFKRHSPNKVPTTSIYVSPIDDKTVHVNAMASELSSGGKSMMLKALSYFDETIISKSRISPFKYALRAEDRFHKLSHIPDSEIKLNRDQFKDYLHDVRSRRAFVVSGVFTDYNQAGNSISPGGSGKFEDNKGGINIGIGNKSEIASLGLVTHLIHPMHSNYVNSFKHDIFLEKRGRTYEFGVSYRAVSGGFKLERGSIETVQQGQEALIEAFVISLVENMFPNIPLRKCLSNYGKLSELEQWRIGTPQEQSIILQRTLRHYGFYKGPVDGSFGEKSIKAAIAYFNRLGIYKDHIPTREEIFIVMHERNHLVK